MFVGMRYGRLCFKIRLRSLEADLPLMKAERIACASTKQMTLLSQVAGRFPRRRHTVRSAEASRMPM